MKKTSFIILMLVISCISSAQDCPKVKISDFPKSDLPPVTFRKLSLKDTSSTDYYYGLGVPVDYKLARYLAFTEMKSDDDDPLSGSSILLMLYANGYGVKRNLTLCIQLACTGNVGGAPAEVEGRTQHLKDMRSGKSKGTFDICDDITSGYMMGMCESLVSAKSQYQRQAATDAILKTWLQKDTAAFGRLRIAATAFFEARSGNEVDMSGTARSAFAIMESDALENNFFNKIVSSGKCSFHNYTAADFLKADKELNVVYKKVMNFNDPSDWGTVTKDGIKGTQRSWLAYRDAWVAFGTVKCPQLSPESLKTMLTKERIDQLKNFLTN